MKVAAGESHDYCSLVTCVPRRHAGEKDKAGDKRENECRIVIDDEIREKDGGDIDYWGD